MSLFTSDPFPGTCDVCRRHKPLVRSYSDKERFAGICVCEDCYPPDWSVCSLDIDAVESYYRTVAPVYAKTHHVGMFGAQAFKTELESKLRPYVNKTSAVLEIGAGTGFATSVLRRLTRSLTVSDRSKEMLSVNSTENPDLKTVQCSAETLPFPDETFDVVAGNNTFYLYTDKLKAASQILRVLKPGGVVVLSEMNPYQPLWPLAWTIKHRWFERSVYQMFPRQMKRYFHGATVKEHDYYSYCPYFGGPRFVCAVRATGRLFGRFRTTRKFTAIRTFWAFKKN